MQPTAVCIVVHAFQWRQMYYVPFNICRCACVCVFVRIIYIIHMRLYVSVLYSRPWGCLLCGVWLRNGICLHFVSALVPFKMLMRDLYTITNAYCSSTRAPCTNTLYSYYIRSVLCIQKYLFMIKLDIIYYALFSLRAKGITSRIFVCTNNKYLIMLLC